MLLISQNCLHTHSLLSAPWKVCGSTTSKTVAVWRQLIPNALVQGPNTGKIRYKKGCFSRILSQNLCRPLPQHLNNSTIMILSPTPTTHYNHQHRLPFEWAAVVRMKGESNYTVFVLANGHSYLSSKSLCVYQPHLPAGFVRVHKGCVVNREFVVRINPYTKGLLMQDGSTVEVARRRWREVVEVVAS